MNTLFFVVLGLYFIAMLLQFAAAFSKKDALKKAALAVFCGAFALHSLFLVLRGVHAGRLPLANQFEFSNAFAWGIALLLLIIRRKMHAEWLTTAAMPAAFLVLSYAALQPMEITELMPALKSVWFGFHIGSAVFSYSAFILAGCAGLRFLLLRRKSRPDDEGGLAQMDYLIYRLVGFGFLMLTVVILSGAIWAEQAWSSFWSWDPKETWALITWIIYAVYLHLRLRQKKEAPFLAWYVVISVPAVLFTFVGVNTLLHGLHTYG